MIAKHPLLSLFALIASVAIFAPPAVVQAQSPAFVAATWNDQSVHFLDSGLNDLGSFPVLDSSPNGIATDGSLIYVGHFTTQTVAAYNFAGTLQFSWAASISSLQGMELVAGELAIANDDGSGDVIEFFDPLTGTYLRSIPGFGSDTEGLAYDGTLLWQLANDLIGIDPLTGTVVSTIPNAAAGEPFGGTGIAVGGPGELVLAAENGAWYRVSSLDGSVISNGNNGLNMYGLKSIPVPEPTSLVLLGLGAVVAGLSRRKQV